MALSAFAFAGSAQFGSTAVLASGGSALAAVTAAVLLNARYVPMGLALAPSLRGRALLRAAYGQAMIDASWAMASRGGGRFDPDFMVGATLPSYPMWVGGTAIGVFAGDLIGDPAALGLDALFPAFFLALLLSEELRARGTAWAVAADRTGTNPGRTAGSARDRGQRGGPAGHARLRRCRTRARGGPSWLRPRRWSSA